MANEQPQFLIDLTRVVMGEMVRIPIALLGRFVKGAQNFSITRGDIANIVANFRKRAADTVIDYEHASEFPDVAAGGPVPAAGWLKQLEDAPDEHGILWGLAQFTGKARAMIAALEYRYLSPAINWGVRDKKTGEAQGATLTSVALVNRPFLEALPPIRLAAFAATPAIQLRDSDWSEEKPMPINETVLQLSDVPFKDGRRDFSVLWGDSVPPAVSIEVLRAQEIDRFVDAALAAGKITPAQRADYVALAESDFTRVRSILDGMKANAAVDLGEHGMAAAAPPGYEPAAGAGSELAQVEEQFAALVRDKVKAGKTRGEAMRLVASDNPELADRRMKLQRRVFSGKETD